MLKDKNQAELELHRYLYSNDDEFTRELELLRQRESFTLEDPNFQISDHDSEVDELCD